MQTLTKTHKIIIGILLLIVLVSLYLFFDRKQVVAPTNTLDTTSTTTDKLDVTQLEENQKITQDGYTIERVAVDEKQVPAPDLSRPVTFAAGSQLTPEVRAMITTKIINLQTELRKNNAYLAAWIDLGMYQKMAGDYTGTIESWVYATKLSPNNFVAYGNLGDLYAYYLKDNAMAELYYKQAIAKGPTQVYLYTQLADVYKDVFKDLDKAKAIIDQGLLKIPKDPALLQYKTNLK